MMWLSLAEKEFEPEFEIALSEDLSIVLVLIVQRAKRSIGC
jgi:hypothetical protein